MARDAEQRSRRATLVGIDQPFDQLLPARSRRREVHGQFGYSPRHRKLEAIQALGGAGYTKDWPVERYLRDAKLYDIGAGTSEIRRFLIGRELIGA